MTDEEYLERLGIKLKILRSIKILEENGYDFYRFEKNVEE